MALNGVETAMSIMLIVEDNEFFRKALKDTLTGSFPSISIAEASNGEQAMREVECLNPSIIFLDIKLPDTNGLILAKLIRQNHSASKIIIFTNYDLPEYRSAAFQNGADHFLVKGSIGPGELTKIVEPMLASA